MQEIGCVCWLRDEKRCIFADRYVGFIQEIMVNRVLIRLKVVQVIYAYYQNGCDNPKSAERELAQSLDSAYSLYKILLYLPVALCSISRKSVARKRRMKEEHIPGKEVRFSENSFIAQLESNVYLSEFAGSTDLSWIQDSDFLKNTYDSFLDSDVLEEYWQEERFDYESDKELCKKLYKSFFMDNEELDVLLEEQNIYWNGDRDLVDSFVLKTFRSFTQDGGADQPLQAEFKDEGDRGFAVELLRAGLAAHDERERVVAANCRRWDPSRLALLDVIIIQVALAELTGFPGIPLKVTINEYVDMAKYLSTPASGSFVNGMLDTIAKELASEGRLNK